MDLSRTRTKAGNMGIRKSSRISWKALARIANPGIGLARDTIATLYTGYLSVERGGSEVGVPV